MKSNNQRLVQHTLPLDSLTTNEEWLIAGNVDHFAADIDEG